MYKREEYVCVFLGGGSLYGAIEILWRGYTHRSMIAVGGIALSFIHFINIRFHKKNIIVRGAIGSAFITLIELAAGVILNIILRLHVWDYSNMFGNVLGQICPLFSLFWFLLSLFAIVISDEVRKMFLFLEKREAKEAESV